MQNNKIYNRLQLSYICLVIASVLTSCTKETLTDCYPPFLMTVKAYNADNKDITNSGEVKEIQLYVFDAQDEFIGMTDATLGASIELNYPGHESLNVVVWGNALSGEAMPTLKVGDKRETAFLALKPKTKARELPVVESPDDLFFGSAEITEENKKTEHVVTINRKISGVIITARKIKTLAMSENGNYSYRLHKSTDKRDFYGTPVGDLVSYLPSAAFNSQDEFIAPIFNILSTTEDIEVDIYKNDVLVTTVAKDSQGAPFKAIEGKLLNILMDFSTQLEVSVSVTPWGETQIWKEF